MKSNCYVTTIFQFTLTRLFFILFLPLFTSAQTPDTVKNIAQTADSTKSSLAFHKTQISGVARSLIDQKKIRTLSFYKRKTKYRIEKDAPLFQLPSGESRVALFELPGYTVEYILAIKSLVHGVGFTYHIFSPSGVFLDSSLNPTHLLLEKNFKMSNPGTYETLGLKTEVPINGYRKSDKYLLIYSLDNSERLATYNNEKGGLLIAMLKHPVMRSPYGKLELEVHVR